MNRLLAAFAFAVFCSVGSSAFASPPPNPPDRPHLPGIVPDGNNPNITPFVYETWFQTLDPVGADAFWYDDVYDELIGTQDFIWNIWVDLEPFVDPGNQDEWDDFAFDFTIIDIFVHFGITPVEGWLDQYELIVDLRQQFQDELDKPTPSVVVLHDLAHDLFDAYSDLIGFHDDAMGTPLYPYQPTVDQHWWNFWDDFHDYVDVSGDGPMDQYITEPDLDLWYGGTPSDYFIMPQNPSGPGGGLF